MLRKWTFMVYMAGDNGRLFKDGRRLMDNLTGYGWANIRQMSKIGSNRDVAIVVQFDTMDAHQTPRFYIDNSSATGTVVEQVAPVNTGDPENLAQFLDWAKGEYTAENYALVLWNHGTGWKEDDIYERYREAIQTNSYDHVRSAAPNRRLLHRALFLSTAAEVMSIADDESRGICYDDTSMDFLDNDKVAQALRSAGFGPGQPLALIGMDACLMSTIEVAYPLQEFAQYLVASQEIESALGWPYDRIVGGLVADPTMSARELGRLIVREFGEYYLAVSRDAGGINTQSAVDLQMVPATFRRMKELVRQIAPSDSIDFPTEIALLRARQRAQSFVDEDYVDLRHFMEVLSREYAGGSDVPRLAEGLVGHLAPGAPGSPVVESWHGAGRPNANGLSVYFPAEMCSVYYDKQAFAQSGWGDVIRLAYGSSTS